MPELHEVCRLISPERIFGELRRVGQNLMARCPFHGDEHPSLSIREDGLWFCFGCWEGGKWTDFLVKRGDAVDTREAYRLLCEMAGIPYNNGNGSNGSTWYRFLSEAEEALKKDKKAMKYLSERGIDIGVAGKYRIGYISRRVMQKWKQRYKLQADFEGRVIFPVKKGVLVGRTLSKSEEKKYINTAGFQKKKHLYNLERVKDKNEIYVVEGILDAILLSETGYPAVAVLGSALSKEQAEQLKQLVGKRIVLIPDGDNAGRQGVKKSASALAEVGFDILYDVDVVHLPDGTDPAEMVKEHPETLKAAVRDRFPLETYLCYLDRKYLEQKFREYMRGNQISRAIYLLSPGCRTERRFERYLTLIERLLCGINKVNKEGG